MFLVQKYQHYITSPIFNDNNINNIFLLSSDLVNETVCIIKGYLCCHDVKQPMLYHIMEIYVTLTIYCICHDIFYVNNYCGLPR